MSKSVKAIATNSNVDVGFFVRGHNPSDYGFHVEVVLTKFSLNESTNQQNVVKKVSSHATDKLLSKAQEKALDKAVELFGL